MAANMPPAEVVVTPALVRSLLSDQRPDLADRDISLLAHGWDNETFRVGDDLVARMPRRDMAAGLVENEARWLPLLASRLTVPVSAPSFLGEPGHGYPWRWVLVPWIPGESAALSEIDHDHVLRPHFVVRNAARLDHAVLPVVAEGAHVPPGQRDQAVLDQVKIRLANDLFERFEHLNYPAGCHCWLGQQ